MVKKKEIDKKKALKQKKEAKKKAKEEKDKKSKKGSEKLLVPNFRIPKTFGQKASDKLAKWAGSWTFIILFFLFIGVWIFFNGYYLIQVRAGEPFDPFPYILLNLALSCLAAIQAPVILMSQNRQAQRDRAKAEFDYRINRKAEEEIRQIRNLLLRRQKKK
jgi:uncharacterized membrane protein